MQTQARFLERFKEVKGFTSDYQLAKYWKIEQSRIIQYRQGRLELTAVQVIDIANTLNIEVGEIYLSMKYFKCKNEEERAVIKDNFFKYFSHAIIMLLVCGSLLGNVLRTPDSTISHNNRICCFYVVFMRKIIKNLFKLPRIQPAFI